MKTSIVFIVVIVSLTLVACGAKPPEYMAVEQGQAVGLSTSAGEKAVTIVYGDPHIARLKVKVLETYYLIDDPTLRNDPDEFIPGNSAQRITGEVLEMKIYHLVVDPNLGENITIGVYLTPSPTVDLRAERTGELAQSSEIYGIPVITWDAGITNRQELYENNVNSLSDVPNLKTFIQGWAVGHLQDDQFLIIGYVPGDVFQEK